MPIPENISIKLVGTLEFPRYVLAHDEDYYIGFNAGWGPLSEALIYTNLKRITTELLLLEGARLRNEWRRMSKEEDNEDNDEYEV